MDSSSSTDSHRTLCAGEDDNGQITPAGLTRRVNLSDYEGLDHQLQARSTTDAQQSTRNATLINVLSDQKPHPDAGLAAPYRLLLSPIIALSRYPYKFVPSRVSERIAKGFFDDGKFWTRTWHIFYVHPPKSVSEQPILFVPFSQFQKLLSEINKALNMGLALGARDRQSGLVMEMPEHPDSVARFVGTSTSRNAFEIIKSQIPKRSESTTACSMPDRAAFVDLMIKATSVAKGGPAATDTLKAEKKKREQTVKQRQHEMHLQETERLLGLRPGIHIAQEPGLELSWDEEVQMRKLQDALAEASLHPESIDVAKAPPFPFEGNVVFIALDLEWWERDARIITEVGISTLDTADLAGVAPGKHGQQWESKIRGKHFRIIEHRNFRNSFSEGNPEQFDFGKTTMINKEDAPQVIASCFKPPYSAPNPTKEALSKARKVVLVGHQMAGDFRALRTLGYDVTNLATLHETVIDTASLYRALRHDANTPALGRIVSEFDFVPWNLHNAGNDAFYTMQAMIAIAICAATEERKDGASDDAGNHAGYSFGEN